MAEDVGDQIAKELRRRVGSGGEGSAWLDEALADLVETVARQAVEMYAREMECVQ